MARLVNKSSLFQYPRCIASQGGASEHYVRRACRSRSVCLAPRTEPTAELLQYNQKLVDIRPSEDSTSITATFADGTEVTGTTLIGSDGHRSVVRRLLLGEEKAAPSFAPYIATRIVLRYPKAEQAIKARSLHPINAMAIHPEGIWSWISSMYEKTTARETVPIAKIRDSSRRRRSFQARDMDIPTHVFLATRPQRRRTHKTTK